MLVIHENIPNMVSQITGYISAEGINIETMVNKSRKDMAVTVMDTAALPSQKALDQLKQLAGVLRVRTFA